VDEPVGWTSLRSREFEQVDGAALIRPATLET